MKESLTSINVFNTFLEDIVTINEHYEDCKYGQIYKNVPLNECSCRCYEKQIFNMGRQAERDLFNGEDRK